ncbi:MAG: prepilin-type N-terminal cleavage/methylation domain-containing protein [Bdellovibrionales bacterium]|nr:prepilin-type N-terminal cleavage/methylation domain-containing protein [Bdellovibrionales bacterium]
MLQALHSRVSTDAGFSVSELLVTIALIAILSAGAVSNLKELDDPLSDASFTVTHYLRLVRARAISQTSFIEVVPGSTTTIAASSSDSCTGVMTPIEGLTVNLPRGSQLTATDWSACFTPRGLSDANVLFTIRDTDGRTRSVEIALGGGVQIQ